MTRGEEKCGQRDHIVLASSRRGGDSLSSGQDAQIRSEGGTIREANRARNLVRKQTSLGTYSIRSGTLSKSVGLEKKSVNGQKRSLRREEGPLDIVPERQTG